MKNFKIICSILVLVMAISIMTFGFYKLFSSKNPELIENIELNVNTTEGDQYRTNGESYEGTYNFKVTNKNNMSTGYSVILEDNSNEVNSIARKDINYKLYVNNVIVHAGELSDLEDNILDTRMISKNTTYDYKLEIWTDIVSSDKDYQYRIKIGKMKK